MRFVSFTPPAGETAPDAVEPARLGLVVGDDTVVDLQTALSGQVAMPSDLGSYLTAGPDLHHRVTVAVNSRTDWPEHATYPLADVSLRMPYRPGKVVGVGLNYVEHVEESSRTLDTAKELPDRPVLFSKPATACIGPDEPIRHNAAITEMLDWECELAVVIGKPAFGVSEDEAMEYVFGYSIANDISARDQRRSGQWFFSKGQDSFCPFGPMVVTADEIGDPHRLQLRLTVNGHERQNGNSRHMLFKIPRLIAEITSGVTLEAGDVISTGSPQGVGAAMDPATFLQPGDVVECTIEGIGTLRNPVEAV